MAEPLVSIIIPLYNAGRYLSEAITSAVQQSYFNTELIIVDDGSQDNSLAVAKKYEGGKVQVLSQNNQGASAARNLGLSKAKGKYIQFLDADDLMSADKISVQVEALERTQDKLAVCSTVKFKNGTNHAEYIPSPRDEPFIYNTDDVVDFLVDLYGGYKKRGSMIGIHAWLIPADLIQRSGPWNESLTVDDDGEFFCRMVLNSAGIVRTNGLCYYRVFTDNKTNLSARTDHGSLQSMIDSFHLKKNYLLEMTNSDAAHFAIYKQTLNLAIRTYMIDRQLYRQMNEELKSFPYYDYKPIIGGKFLNLITDMFGWRVSRFLQYHYSRF